MILTYKRCVRKWNHKSLRKRFLRKISYRWTLQNQDGHFQLSIFSCGQISVWSWCCCHTPKRIIAGVVPVQEISPDHLSLVRIGCSLLRKIVRKIIIWIFLLYCTFTFHQKEWIRVLKFRFIFAYQLILPSLRTNPTLNQKWASLS